MAASDALEAAKGRIASMLEPIDGGVGADLLVRRALRWDQGRDRQDELARGRQDRLGQGRVERGRAPHREVEGLPSSRSTWLPRRRSKAGSSARLDGLVLLNELNSAFWDKMYPPLKRPQARAATLMSWFADQVGAVIVNFVPTAKDADIVGALDSASRARRRRAPRTNSAMRTAGIGPIRDATRQPRRERAQGGTAAAAAASASAAAAASAASAASAAGRGASASASASASAGGCRGTTRRGRGNDGRGSRGNVDRGRRERDDGARAGEQLAHARRRRASRFGSDERVRVSDQPHGALALDAAGSAERGGTNLPAFAAGSRARGARGHARGVELGRLLASIDEVVAEHRLWLDPHRYASAALDSLGHADAKVAYLKELALLLQRAPELVTLTFNDGVPFADEQTRAWIDAEVRPMLGAGGAATAAGGARRRACWQGISRARQSRRGGGDVHRERRAAHGDPDRVRTGPSMSRSSMRRAIPLP